MEKVLNLNEVNGLFDQGNRVNVPLGWLYDCLNGYITKTPDGTGTIIEQRRGLYKEPGNAIGVFIV
jgi:hypothetical protein